MIVGSVNAQREAWIPLAVNDAQGSRHDLTGLVDTGFSGWLTLPPPIIAALGLTWRSRGKVQLANGTEEEFDSYAVMVLWDGRNRHVLVEAVDVPPLVGMRLLAGYDVHIRVLDGGPVTITPAP